jgi:hypothetical protein
MNLSSIYKCAISILIIIGFFQIFTFSTQVVENVLEQQKFYAAKPHEIKKNYDFCGEAVPIESKDIKERLDREILKNSYWHSEMLIYYKRVGKYFPIIEPILKKYNIPDDFKYLAVIESGLSNAVSPAGARGFWQIMEKTGEEFGLEVNKEVDERYHLIKATEAACKYLNASYKRFNSWTLVAASYNMGMGGVSKRLKQQKVNNYYDLLLNTETSRYVFRIIAIKDILSKPLTYGYNIESQHRYKEDKFKFVEYDSTITSLTDFAIQNNINYKILKLGNPWLRRKNLTNSKRKKYTFKILQSEYKILSENEYYNKPSTTVVSDSLNSILKKDSISSQPIDTISKKYSIISDSLLKENEIGEVKK